MTEETIERVFRPFDWHEATCDRCTDFTSVVLIEDVKACRKCLETLYTERGDYRPDQTKAFEEINADIRARARASMFSAIVSAYSLGALTVWVILGVAR